MDYTAIWSGGLTLVITLLGWTLNNAYLELKRMQILLNRTREEMAKEYITKVEVQTDLNRMMTRLDALDAKLDRLIERP